MKKLFAQNSVSYDLRDYNVLEIPRYNTTRYNTVTYGFSH